ncbi:phospholipase D-like domain-containing protein [Oceanivirga salmonicida]|uniref:phospholipase D-like domain-containing protein n=1 Tax=Oceanivirga salmonicida TaxID=1769291 RepID=UPI0008311B43|nr:phospholipase D-like domain-containing protein [Oceanivirga salmonicida]
MVVGLKRIMLILFSVMFQFGILWWLFNIFPEAKTVIIYILTAISIVVTLYIIKSDINPDYKLSWMFLIFLTPILGSILFLLSKRSSANEYSLNLEASTEISKNIDDDSYLIDNLKTSNKRQAYYLKKHANAGIYKNNDIKYYSSGESMWEDMLIELDKAKKFIFMEYFIVQNGIMLDKILEILKRKASEGVDVRFTFDSFGSIFKAPNHFAKKLRKHGIKCYPYNSKVRIFDMHFNNRDHRKITIIDGKVAFTGGLNLADEYINEVNLFGHWKDTGIRVKGSSVNFFTIMFLTLWGICEDKIPNYTNRLVKDYEIFENDGIISPYTDYPGDAENVGETMYSEIVKGASDYVYITTPYLILNYNMINELVMASKAGVDVRIIVPGIPDKKLIYMLTKSFYPPLINAGVRIFEYTPGFIHCKQFVSDNKSAIIGTINLDYRSLTHNIENAVWLLNDKSVLEIKKDFLDIQEKSKEVELKNKKWSIIIEVILLPIFRAFAPLF